MIYDSYEARWISMGVCWKPANWVSHNFIIINEVKLENEIVIKNKVHFNNLTIIIGIEHTNYEILLYTLLLYLHIDTYTSYKYFWKYYYSFYFILYASIQCYCCQSVLKAFRWATENW